MLDKSIGLKFNTQIILGREEVITFLEEHKIYFAELDVSPIEDSKMIYGYNKLGNPVKLGFDGQAIQRIVLVTKTLKTIRYKAVCTYDGHRYNGFQIQKNHNTIQGELTKIISSVNGKDTLVQGASRTDTGVHALNYVFHFDSDKSLSESRWLELLNYQLPNDIHIKSICKTHPLFHSRYDVHMKRYIYKIKLIEVKIWQI